MSKWGKTSRPQGIIVPIDSLIKEKENANRPTALRSAGSIGRWGITSFTSIRNTSFEFGSTSPTEESPVVQNTPSIAAITPVSAPKPKKFFKSRNSSIQIDTNQLALQLQQQSMTANVLQSSAASNEIKIEKSRKKSDHHEEKHPKKEKKEKKLKKEKPPPKEPIRPTRNSARTRNKKVNYNEDQSTSRSPSPSTFFESTNLMDQEDQNDQDDAEGEEEEEEEEEEKVTVKEASPPPPVPIIVAPVTVVVPTPAPPVEHPPIVLRISKGTSRLISTDSEDVHSPPHHHLQHPPQLKPEPINTILKGAEKINSTAELLAVLSEEPAPVKPISTDPPKPVEPVDNQETHQHKKEDLKIKISLSSISSSGNGKPKKGYHFKKRAIKRATRGNRKDTDDDDDDDYCGNKEVQISVVEPLKIADPEPILIPQIKPQFPHPGTDAYELYKTLASPSEKDFDSQSSILGSVSSNNTPNNNILQIEDSRIIHSRGSSDATSDLELSQNSSTVAAPPSDQVVSDTVAESEENDKKEDQCKEPEKVESLKLNIKLKTATIATTKTTRQTRNTRNKMKSNLAAELLVEPPPAPIAKIEPIVEKPIGRVTRNRNNNNNVIVEEQKSPPPPPPTRSYGRKRRLNDTNGVTASVTETSSAASSSEPQTDAINLSVISESSEKSMTNSAKSEMSEYKIKNKFKRSYYKQEDIQEDLHEQMVQQPVVNAKDLDEEETIKHDMKLVISKKKGSIFKSRPLVSDGNANEAKKRHVYKHKWDDDSKDKTILQESTADKKSANSNLYYSDFEGESSGLSRVTRSKADVHDFDDEDDEVTSVKCDKRTKPFYTVVRNVKKAHQIQEIGEFQEMDDDAEYILSALQSDNPNTTRCLSAIQLAAKCMTPAFRMHVRAHGTVMKFFKALKDAHNDQGLGLCTAAIMFVLSQDTLNMDLDRDSLELMLNLLDMDHKTNAESSCLSSNQLKKNKQKVKEFIEEIQSQGKAKHINLDSITVGTLAMETLLSLTSKRAGEWFKEELRNLGGLEHIIKTICECCRVISDYVVEWTDDLLSRLRKIERCLRVLENVTQMNEQNQKYILGYNDGVAIDVLVKLYKLIDSEITLYPTNDKTPKDHKGVVLREAIIPILKVLINLTHPYDNAYGSVIIGDKPFIIDTSLHLLLKGHNYMPENCLFELNILVLLLLINLTMHTNGNRILVMEAKAPNDFENVYNKVPAIKSLIEYFYNREELARLAEQNTDALLDDPRKKEKQEEVDETVTKLLQKAGHHMEHTMCASYVSLLIGYLVVGCPRNEQTVRRYLRENEFSLMVAVLEKYYNFMNLTASSEAVVVAHIKQTKNMIDNLKQLDNPPHSQEKSQDLSLSKKSITRPFY